MSIADEARAEAERLYPRDDPQLSHVGKKANADRREGYERGYSDGASRKPEAAPSDTDQKNGHDDGCADFYPEYGAPESGVCKVCGENVTSQPVQVEVTESPCAFQLEQCRCDLPRAHGGLHECRDHRFSDRPSTPEQPEGENRG